MSTHDTHVHIYTHIHTDTGTYLCAHSLYVSLSSSRLSKQGFKQWVKSVRTMKDRAFPSVPIPGTSPFALLIFETRFHSVALLPATCYVDQPGLEFIEDPSASASQVLRFKASATRSCQKRLLFSNV